MVIGIYNHPQEILVQTVSVHKNLKDPLNTYLFRCPYCGWRVAQIQGVVDKLQPGLRPTEEVVIINQCPECHMRYIFQHSKSRRQDSEITLTMYENPADIFRCYICRTALLKFNEYEVVQLSNKTARMFPFGLTCNGWDCHASYRFIDLI